MKTICIIGAGLSGGFLAHYLVESGKFKVLLVDVDSINDSYPSSNSSFNLTPFSEFSNFNTYALGYGGTSNLWHGVMTDFDEIDLIRSKQLSGNIDFLLHDFGSVGNKLFPGLDVSLGKKSLSPLNTDFIPLDSDNYFIKSYYVPRKPLRMRQMIKNLSRLYPSRLVLLSNSVAVNFNISVNIDNGYTVDSLNVSTNNSPAQIKADFFVACLGALETPRLIYQSFQTIGIANKWIGNSLLEHPYARIADIYFGKFTRLSLKSPSFFQDHITRYNLIFRGLTDSRNPSISFIPSIDVSLSTFMKSFSKISSLTPLKQLNKLSPVGASTQLINKLNISYTDKVGLYIHHEVLSSDGGSITFTENIDVHGRLIPSFNYPSLVSLDKINPMLIEKLCCSTNLRGTNSSISILPSNEVSYMPGSHYAGTCKISINKSHGVCSSNLNVHDFSNLYICDASVFPVVGNSNLSLPLLRLASYLSSKLCNNF